MATLPIEQIERTTGLTPTFSAASAGGDDFMNTGRQYVEIVNGDASPVDVTFVTPGTVDGLAVADHVVSVPASSTKKVGPFPTSVYNASDGLLSITYASVTSLTVGVFQI